MTEFLALILPKRGSASRQRGFRFAIEGIILSHGSFAKSKPCRESLTKAIFVINMSDRTWEFRQWCVFLFSQNLSMRMKVLAIRLWSSVTNDGRKCWGPYSFDKCVALGAEREHDNTSYKSCDWYRVFLFAHSLRCFLFPVASHSRLVVTAQ